MSTTGNWRGPNIVKDGLIFYLDPGSPNSYFDKTSTVIKDISGRTNNGTLINGPTYSSANGGSILFDGIDDYVLTSLKANRVEFTIDIWAKLVTTTNGVNLCVDDGAGYFGLGFYNATQKIQMACYDTSAKSAISTNVINPNVIYNFTGTWKGGDYVNLYINGVFDSQSSTTLAPTGIGSNANAIKLCKNGSFYVSGNIYDILLYNRALTAQEIQQNHNSTKSRFGL
jgi:hypothetical protein